MKVKSGILISNSVFITETQRHKVLALYTSSLCASQPSCLCVKNQNENAENLEENLIGFKGFTGFRMYCNLVNPV